MTDDTELDPGTLTERQRAIYRFLAAHLLREGRFPTFREIGDQFAIASPNGVNGHLAALEKKGVLAREVSKWQALKLAGVRLRLEFDDTPEGRRARALLSDL